MEKYKELLDSLFMAESNAPISNSCPKHAVILLTAIFHFSHKTVNVFCGNLRSDVFGKEDLVSEIRCAAFRGVKVHFILEHKPENKEIEELAKQFPKLVKIDVLAEKTEISHFAVGDGKAFRFEENHGETKALGCANNPEIAALLEKAFADLSGRCAA